MSDRPRPPNAAGPNGLRGGIKTYAPRTITGPWLDALGGTAGYKRGFTTSEYETEAQHQQKGALLQNDPEFGAGLPDELQLSRPDSPFKYTASKNNNENVWATNTKLMSTALLTQPKDYEVPTALKPRMPADKLEEYRRNWTIESDAMREVRFSTETRISGSAVGGGKFSTNTVRSLPGTPKAYESYRQAIIEKYGLFAFTAVKYHLNLDGNMDTLSSREFRAALARTGVDMKLYEVNQILAYTSPSTSPILPVKKFIEILKGHVLGFPKTWVERLWGKMEERVMGQGRDSVTTSDILSFVSASFPEISLAISQYASSVYVGGGVDGSGIWSANSFTDLQHDMYSANPLLYAEAMRDIWGLKVE